MALYKHLQQLSWSQDSAFDDLRSPGTPAPHSGIYQCAHCGHEVALRRSEILPPENHGPHDPGMGVVKWRLLVFACK